MISRRSLITGLISLAAAPAIVRASSIMQVKPLGPFIWGDGIHDDSDGINAMLNGKPHIVINAEAAFRKGDLVTFGPGNFLLGRPMIVAPGAQLTVVGSEMSTIFQAAEHFSGAAIFEVEETTSAGRALKIKWQRRAL
jgi:hypothetical protein